MTAADDDGGDGDAPIGQLVDATPARRPEAVTLEEVNAVARELLTRPFGAAVLGPHRSKRALPKQLRSIG